MTTQEAIFHFKSGVGVASALGITKAAVSRWGEYPPFGRQCEIEILTRGALKAERPVRAASKK